MESFTCCIGMLQYTYFTLCSTEFTKVSLAMSSPKDLVVKMLWQSSRPEQQHLSYRLREPPRVLCPKAKGNIPSHGGMLSAVSGKSHVGVGLLFCLFPFLSFSTPRIVQNTTASSSSHTATATASFPFQLYVEFFILPAHKSPQTTFLTAISTETSHQPPKFLIMQLYDLDATTCS
ncbi:hypothetical protein V6N12_045958 [Hibiscus sabdariffa]|uniref:Uncharacterized protein n=1 Tax=Hibiscus sabdariffa TaxID=183260 RepID=A0ABR2G4A1_9ROSI